MVEEAFVNIEDLDIKSIPLTNWEKKFIIEFAKKIKKIPSKVRVYVA